MNSNTFTLDGKDREHQQKGSLRRGWSSMAGKVSDKVAKFFYAGHRSFDDYAGFIYQAIRQGYQFQTLNDFSDSSKRTIALRHDVDGSLAHAAKLARVEHRANVKATYFVLHTAKYFYQNISKGIINKELIPTLLYLQNDLGHEIGLHTDLVTIECAYKKDPRAYLSDVLSMLREEGIRIYGIAPHGTLLLSLFRKGVVMPLGPSPISSIFRDGSAINLGDFDLTYDVHSIGYEKYFTDAAFDKRKRWDYSTISREFFEADNRTMILTHPVHWYESRAKYYSHNLFLNAKYTLEYLGHYRNYLRSK